jgi:hypothetical protein
VRFRAEARLRPGPASPLVELLPGERLGEGLLGGVPADAFFLAALPGAEGRELLQPLLRLIDTWHADTAGEGPAPGELLRRWERHGKVRLGRDVLARVKGVAAGYRMRPEANLSAAVTPFVVVEAAGVAAARDLEALLPRLLAEGDRPAEPRALSVEGPTVLCLLGEEEARKGERLAYYGRRGPTLVLGWDPRTVAAGLCQKAPGADLADHPGALAALGDAGPVGAALLFSGRQWLAQVTRGLAGAPGQSDKDLRRIRYVRELGTPLAAMPPTLLLLRRGADGLRVEARQTDLRVASGTVIDVLAGWLIDEATSR